MIDKDVEPHKDWQYRYPVKCNAAVLEGATLLQELQSLPESQHPGKQGKVSLSSLSWNPSISCWCFPLTQPNWKLEANRVRVIESTGSIPFTPWEMEYTKEYREQITEAWEIDDSHHWCSFKRNKVTFCSQCSRESNIN